MADGDNITFANLSSLMSPGTQTSQSNAQQAAGFDAKTQASLDSLQPDFADRTRQWIQTMRDNGFDPVLHMGYRSPDEQQALYVKHLAGGPQAVAPAMSYHTYGRAFDWVNRDSKGNLDWNNDKAYEFGQKLATAYGMAGIGPGDNDHIQDANYKSWKDLPKSDYGVPGNTRRVAQAQTNRPAPVAAALQSSNIGGVTFQDLSSLMQR